MGAVLLVEGVEVLAGAVLVFSFGGEHDDGVDAGVEVGLEEGLVEVEGGEGHGAAVDLAGEAEGEVGELGHGVVLVVKVGWRFGVNYM